MHLPLEIWQQIFTHACTDGGYTGASLALVSKFFHSASFPTRFRSLAFTSLRQIERFLSRYSTLSHDGRRLKVQHLLLSFSFSPLNESSSEHLSSYDDVKSRILDPDPNMWVRARYLRELEKAVWDQRFLVLVPSLLDFVAPHLETFALIQSDGFAIPAIRHTLPHLRELTLLMGITVMLSGEPEGSQSETSAGSTPGVPRLLPPAAPDPTSDSTVTEPLADAPATHAAPTPSLGDDEGRAGSHSRSASPSPSPSPFPALERLHIVCGRHRDWTLREGLARLPLLAPALTHLRISNATYTHGSDGCISGFLRDALAMPHVRVHNGPAPRAELDTSGATDLSDAARAMPTLRRVVVHSVPPPLGGRYGGPYKDYSALVDSLKEMVAACEDRRDLRVSWMERERARHQVWEQTVRAQWMDRIEGRRGCWGEPADSSDEAMPGSRGSI